MRFGSRPALGALREINQNTAIVSAATIETTRAPSKSRRVRVIDSVPVRDPLRAGRRGSTPPSTALPRWLKQLDRGDHRFTFAGGKAQVQLTILDDDLDLLDERGHGA